MNYHTYFAYNRPSSDALPLTEALAEAVAKAAMLTVEDQNYIAFRIMEEVSDEKKWTDSFVRSQDVVGKMAVEALEEHRQGKTIPLEELLEEPV